MSAQASGPQTDVDLIFNELSRLDRQKLYEFARDVGRIRKLSQANKDEIERTIRRHALSNRADQTLSFSDVVRFVGEQAALGKQHVTLWTVTPQENDQWDTADGARAQIRAGGGDPAVLGLDEPLAAPDVLSLSRVAYRNGMLLIDAAGKRESKRHNEAEERRVQATLPSGMTAVVWEKVIERAWVRLAWNTRTREAALQIGQLGGDHSYEDVRQQFFDLVPWLPRRSFTPVNLATVVAALHEQVEQEVAAAAEGREAPAEVQLQGLDYLTGGVRSSSTSRAARQSLLADKAEVVAALRAIRENGVAERGNAYWRTAQEGGPAEAGILQRELHTTIAADQGRVHVRRSVTPDELKYVLGRIRALSV